MTLVGVIYMNPMVYNVLVLFFYFSFFSLAKMRQYVEEYAVKQKPAPLLSFFFLLFSSSSFTLLTL